MREWGWTLESHTIIVIIVTWVLYNPIKFLQVWANSKSGFLLVPKAVVDLINSLFPEVSAVDSFRIIIRNIGDFWGLGNWVALFMDKSHELLSL